MHLMQKNGGGVTPTSSAASDTVVKTEGTKSSEVSTKSAGTGTVEGQKKAEADLKKSTLSAVAKPTEKEIYLAGSDLHTVGVTYAKNAEGKSVNYMYKSKYGGNGDTDAILHVSLDGSSNGEDYKITKGTWDLDYFNIRNERNILTQVRNRVLINKDTNLFDANLSGFNDGQEYKLKAVDGNKSYTLKAVTNTKGEKVVALQLDDGKWYDMNELLKGNKTEVTLQKS